MTCHSFHHISRSFHLCSNTLCQASMRLRTFSKRSSLPNGVDLRKITTNVYFDERNLSHTIQGRLGPSSNIQWLWCDHRKLARFFSHARSDELLDMPRSCPGCGAFSQITNADQAGYYGGTRKAVQAFIARSRKVQSELREKKFDFDVGFTHRSLPSLLNNYKGQRFSKISG